MDIKTGAIVQLKEPLLGNEIGAVGVCYDAYTLDGRDGWGFIFENGDHDGFSESDVERFLHVLRTDRILGFVEMPKFVNVMQLSTDYRNRRFAPWFDFAREIRPVKASNHLVEE